MASVSLNSFVEKCFPVSATNLSIKSERFLLQKKKNYFLIWKIFYNVRKFHSTYLNFERKYLNEIQNIVRLSREKDDLQMAS